MGHRTPRLIPLALLAAIVTAAVVGVVMVPRGEGAVPHFAGTVLLSRAAPSLHLRDQFGRTITLSQFRGRPVILTFMQAHCRAACPVIAEKIRQALGDLGRPGRPIAVVAVSADPEGDTPAAVRAFSRTHRLLHRWHYLTGSRAALTPIWHAYYVYVPPRSASPASRDLHTSATFLIDRDGHERVLFTTELTSLSLERDLRILLGLPVRGSEAEMKPAPEAGHPAPDFTLKTSNGSRLALSALRGQVVLLNFWATWCIPCRTEMPELERWYRAHRDQRFVVLGINEQEGSGDVVPFLQKLHITYPIVLDESGSVSAQYNIIGLPSTFVVNRQGMIEAVKLGAVDRRYLETTVGPLVRAGG